jgi:hypothetical protein
MEVFKNVLEYFETCYFVSPEHVKSKTAILEKN